MKTSTYKTQMLTQFCDLLKNSTEEEIKAAMGAPAAPLKSVVNNSVPPIKKKVNTLKVTGFTPAQPVNTDSFSDTVNSIKASLKAIANKPLEVWEMAARRATK